MKEEYKDLELVHDTKRERFEMHVGDELAFIEYKKSPTAIFVMHTEVTPELEGKGAATAIIEKVLDYIEHTNLKLVPLCPLVAAYIKRHPEWNKIVDERVNITA